MEPSIEGLGLWQKFNLQYVKSYINRHGKVDMY
jgi:hypothetical protein